MSDFHQIRTDWLNSVHNQNAATKHILGAVSLIVIGGEEGLQEIAASNPEAILAAFDSLALVIANMQEQFNTIVEEKLASLDALEEITNTLRSI